VAPWSGHAGWSEDVIRYLTVKQDGPLPAPRGLPAAKRSALKPELSTPNHSTISASKSQASPNWMPALVL